MKKIKLLMPILGISAIATTAIPLAGCSCKSTETTIDQDAWLAKYTEYSDSFQNSTKKYSKAILTTNGKTSEFDITYTDKTESVKRAATINDGSKDMLLAGGKEYSPSALKTTFDLYKSATPFPFTFFLGTNYAKYKFDYEDSHFVNIFNSEGYLTHSESVGSESYEISYK